MTTRWIKWCATQLLTAVATPALHFTCSYHGPCRAAPTYLPCCVVVYRGSRRLVQLLCGHHQLAVSQAGIITPA